MASYQLTAINTAPDSPNKIHDDIVAREYGFRAGLVPGVTVYGYMIPLVVDRFGEEWLERGAMEVRFKEPVYEGELVGVTATPGESGRLHLSVAAGRTTGIATMPEEMAAVEASPGRKLKSLLKTLELRDPAISAPLPAALGHARRAHPAILLSLANEVLMQNFELGPWIHVKSEIRNLASAADGDELTVDAAIIETYERKGHEFVVLDVCIVRGGEAIQKVTHTAIWKPNFVKR